MGTPNGIYRSSTFSGQPVVIYTLQAGGERPIHGAYFNKEAWMPVAWTKEGKLHSETRTGLDLVISTELGNGLSALEKEQGDI